MIGSIVVLLGVLGALGAISWLTSSRARPTTTHGATHLEWASIATPPPVGNFAEPPARVRSAPLLDETPGDEGRRVLMTATTTQLAAPAIRRPRTVLVGTMLCLPAALPPMTYFGVLAVYAQRAGRRPRRR